MNAATFASGSNTAPAMGQQWARDSIGEWSAICQHFLDRQRSEIFLRDPSDEDRESHRKALKWLLHITRLIYATADDPDYPDKSIASEIHGRLIQLEHSWRMTQEQRPEAEADKLLKELFPE